MLKNFNLRNQRILRWQWYSTPTGGNVQSYHANPRGGCNWLRQASQPNIFVTRKQANSFLGWRNQRFQYKESLPLGFNRYSRQASDTPRSYGAGFLGHLQKQLPYLSAAKSLLNCLESTAWSRTDYLVIVLLKVRISIVTLPHLASGCSASPSKQD